MTGPGPSVGDWTQVVLLSVCGALAAILELLFVPLYVGSVLVPVVVVFAVAGNVLLPRLAYGLVRTTRAALAPFLCWLLPLLALSMLPRPEGDVLVVGAGGQMWTFYGVVLGGALTATVTIVLITGAGSPRGPVGGAPARTGRPMPPGRLSR